MTDAHAPRIILAGATGRTGNAVAHALATRDEDGDRAASARLVAVVAPSVATTPSRPLPDGVPAFATLVQALDEHGGPGAVLVDITHADAATAHLQLALERAVPAVVGTTGFGPGVLEGLGTRFAAAGLGLLVVPNFSIGAVLAMRVAEQLAAHFPDAEIVETHHDGKRDSPSGTAAHTAALIARARARTGVEPGTRSPGAASAGTDPSRGELIQGVPVHALRIPGATAHQEVVFGAPGEIVTIRHDAIDRSCYASGVVIAARHVIDGGLVGLETGLEHAL